MTRQALAAALLGLFPGPWTTYDGAPVTTVTPDGGVVVPAPPYVSVSVRMPPAERAATRALHAVEVTAIATCVGATTKACRGVTARVIDYLEGARLAVPGWECGPVEVLNEREPTPDRDAVITGTNTHPVYAVVELRLTASHIPA